VDVIAMKQSAGTLLFRRNGEHVEVLLVHPSGNFNRRAPWGIPKGLIDEDEDAEAAARRETLEETGVTAERLHAVGSIDYTRSRKRIHCFVGESPPGAEPYCASWEVDRAEFLSLKEAREVMHPDQLPFLDRLQTWLDEHGQPQ
jgi:predicted NUDIX family NTP pyrophosphohydrolase